MFFQLLWYDWIPWLKNPYPCDGYHNRQVEAATSRVASPEPPAVAVAVPVAEPAEPAQEAVLGYSWG
jgi:hypothetical protein